MARVLLIGGGVMQLRMIDEIERRGHSLIVTDGDPNCPARHRGLPFFCVSVYDIDGHLRLFGKLDLRVDAVLTVATDAGPTVSAVAELLGLRACSLRAALRARHKPTLRERLGHEHPRYFVIKPNDPITRIREYWRLLGEDAVLKASDNRGSRGFSVVRGGLLDLQVARARKASGDGLILMEERLFGQEVAIDTFIVEGRARLVNSALRHFSQPGIELGHVNPGPWEAVFEEIATDAARKLGVTEGPFKLDLIHDQRYGWCVLEAATRLSGGFDHFLTAELGPGRDVTGLMLDYALGLPFDASKAQPKRAWFAAAMAPPFEPGEIYGYTYAGAPELPKSVIPLEFETIYPLSDCAARPLFVIGEGPTAEAAWEAAGKEASYVRPVYRDRHRPDRQDEI